MTDNTTTFMIEFFNAHAATQAELDAMRLREAMAEPGADKFLDTMAKEIDDHVQRKHWRLMTDKEMRASGHKS